MITAKESYPRFPLDGLWPPGHTTGNFQPEKRENPEEKTQKTRSSFTVDLKPYLRIKSELTTININIQRVNN